MDELDYRALSSHANHRVKFSAVYRATERKGRLFRLLLDSVAILDGNASVASSLALTCNPRIICPGLASGDAVTFSANVITYPVFQLGEDDSQDFTTEARFKLSHVGDLEKA